MPLFLALLVLLVLAPAAGAATVELRTFGTYGGGRDGERTTRYEASVRAPGDERNALRLAIEGAAVVARDASAPLVAGRAAGAPATRSPAH